MVNICYQGSQHLSDQELIDLQLIYVKSLRLDLTMNYVWHVNSAWEQVVQASEIMRNPLF
jgi:hypothetical protein